MRRDMGWEVAVAAMIACLSTAGSSSAAQGFGLPGLHKKIVLERKLPSISRIDGKTFKVVVEGTKAQAEIATDLKSTIENLLIHNDPQLQTDEVHPDTVLTCRITSYDQPPPVKTELANAKKGAPPIPMQRITGLLVLNFQAKSTKSGQVLTADSATAKFDQEFSPSGADKGIMHSMSSLTSHITKGTTEEDTPPTVVELHNRLIQDASLQVVSHFVTTTEQVEAYVASGKSLDAPANMELTKLWERALDTLAKTAPFPKPDDDAYRIYDMGLANEALGYAAPDINVGLKYLLAAADNYSKAIDTKPLEKNFLIPEARIETAIAHYKTLTALTLPNPPGTTTAAPAPAPSQANSDVLDNAGVVAMVSAGLDEANIVDTIQHAKAVNFDLTPQAQVNLAKSGVNGKIILAMKTRARSRH